MADNFGLKLGIDGEKEFKKALSEINQSFKVLGSEMKLVSSQFAEPVFFFIRRNQNCKIARFDFLCKGKRKTEKYKYSRKN